MTPLIFDEINNLSAKIREKYRESTSAALNRQLDALNDEYLYDHPEIDPEEIEDEVLDLLILAWTMGNGDANDELSIDIEPDVDAMNDCVYRDVEGENFADRIYRHAADGDIEGIIRTLETEAVHSYNDGKLWTAKAGEEEVKASGETSAESPKVTPDTSTILPSITPTIPTGFPTIPGATPIVVPPSTSPTSPVKPTVASGKTIYKVWCTQLDDKVRDSHFYLEGVKQGLDDYFYTYGGSRALYPTGFGVPEEDCGCRCYIKLSAE